MGVPIQVQDAIYKYHKRGDHLVSYEISDSDETGDPKYYGYLNAEGGWIIMEWTSPGTYRYCAGNGVDLAYKTAITGAWATRAGLTFVYFNEI